MAACRVGSSEAPREEACNETPARDRWPEDYGLARGQKEIWLIDNGVAHGVGAKRKVGWRVIGAVESLEVKAQRLDGPESFAMTIADRVAPNGRDRYPTYWDSVSFLTFPAAGCWAWDLTAGEKQERITLHVR